MAGVKRGKLWQISAMTDRPVRPPPTVASLHQAALAHLARYAATRAGLLRVLHRRIERWSQAMPPDDAPDRERVATLRAIAGDVVERLVTEGLVDDAAYAERRGLRLLQAGRSPKAAVSQLRARGVAADLAAAAVPDLSLDAALILARRRRIGPFRHDDPDAEGQRREQGILARAGFSRDIALQALQLGTDEAEQRIIEFRRQS